MNWPTGGSWSVMANDKCVIKVANGKTNGKIDKKKMIGISSLRGLRN